MNLIIAVMLGGGIWVGTIQTSVADNTKDIDKHAEEEGHSEDSKKLVQLETRQEQLISDVKEVDKKVDLILDEIRRLRPAE